MKAAVREVATNLPDHQFVFRTDVKGYYASINHHILMDIVGRYVQDEKVLALLWGYLRRYVSNGGRFMDITQGISLGCPLSPLMGALFLKPLDDAMVPLLGGDRGGLGCFYVRFMDDWVILAPTRWKLRRAIKAVNEVMNDLQVEQHPDKTFIGRIARGFDFLGYWFSPTGLAVAKKTIERMLDKVSRLYEQGADDNCVEEYVRRWGIWVRSGVCGVLEGLALLGFVTSTQPTRSVISLWVKSGVDGFSRDGDHMLGCEARQRNAPTNNIQMVRYISLTHPTRAIALSRQ
jgi:hypothetical protein